MNGKYEHTNEVGEQTVVVVVLHLKLGCGPSLVDVSQLLVVGSEDISVQILLRLCIKE